MTTGRGRELLIDSGNSRVKWGWGSKDGIVANAALENREIESTLQRLWGRELVPCKIWLANSAGERREHQLRHIVEVLWGIEVHSVRSSTSFGGIINSYHAPGQLGVDRWLGLIASWRRVRGSLCLVDCGTAITIDLINGSGNHQGGVILPEIGVSWAEFAEKVPHLSLDQGSSSSLLLGKSTEEGLRYGQSGSVATVDRVLEEIFQQHGLATLLVTGGGGKILQQESAFGFLRVENLVLEGLFQVAKSDNYQ